MCFNRCPHHLIQAWAELYTLPLIRAWAELILWLLPLVWAELHTLASDKSLDRVLCLIP